MSKDFAIIDAEYRADIDAADAAYDLATSSMARRYPDGDAHRAAFAAASVELRAAHTAAMEKFAAAWRNLTH
jgi:hypothetical protein